MDFFEESVQANSILLEQNKADDQFCNGETAVISMDELARVVKKEPKGEHNPRAIVLGIATSKMRLRFIRLALFIDILQEEVYQYDQLSDDSMLNYAQAKTDVENAKKKLISAIISGNNHAREIASVSEGNTFGITKGWMIEVVASDPEKLHIVT